MRQRREEQQHGSGKHQHLGAQSGTTAIRNEHAPGRGETEQRVIEDEPQCATQEKQRALPPSIGVRECQCACRQQSRSESHYGGIDVRNEPAVPCEQPGVNGKIGHEWSRLFAAPPNA
jgi:hypothetical protein